jgi:hypothetical protein
MPLAALLDRGDMTILALLRLLSDDASRERVPNFRVLTMTTNEERMRHMMAACHFLGGAVRLFLFADQGTIPHRNMLTHAWRDGHNEKSSLVPTHP